MSKELKDVIDTLSGLMGDIAIPKNIKIRLQTIINILKEETETSTKVNKALQELDEIADDANIQPYTRTEIWNIASLLEKLA